MICSSCRRSLLSRLSSTTKQTTSRLSQLTPHTRSIATIPATKDAPPSQPPPSTQPASPSAPTATSASSPGASQPFSEPFFPSTSTTTTPPPSTTTPSATSPKPFLSSTPGGTPLTSLQYLKSPPKPLLALEDHEYPSWLWSLAKDPNAASSASSDGGVDLNAMTKKMRAKYERKMAKLAATLEKPVPVHEQAKDLVDTANGEGVEVYNARARELTKSMRGARRKGIREANFLRGM